MLGFYGVKRYGGALYKNPLPPKGSFYIIKGRGKKARTAPFIPPLKVVPLPSSASVINFKVVDASGSRVFGGNASKIGMTTVEKTVQLYNELRAREQPVKEAHLGE